MTPKPMTKLEMLEAVKAGKLKSFKRDLEPTASVHRIRLLACRAEGFVVGTVGRSLRLTPAGRAFLLMGDAALNAREREASK